MILLTSEYNLHFFYKNTTLILLNIKKQFKNKYLQLMLLA